MRKPVVHHETWQIVRSLAERWGEPEWKVMHLALVLLQRTAQERPEMADILRSIDGDISTLRGTGLPGPGAADRRPGPDA